VVHCWIVKIELDIEKSYVMNVENISIDFVGITAAYLNDAYKFSASLTAQLLTGEFTVAELSNWNFYIKDLELRRCMKVH